MKGFKLKNIKELREHVVPARASTEEIQNYSELLRGDCGHWPYRTCKQKCASVTDPH